MRIIKYPHPTLRHKSKPVRRVDAELRKMIHQMFDLMYSHDGIGLAANQVDLPYRLFVMNVKCDPAAKEEEFAFINPVILERKGGTEEKEEGCLSLPDVHGQVKRAKKIVLNAYSLSGEEVTWEMDGMYARVAQHECDHLDGILFIDRLGPASFLQIKEALEDLEAIFNGERQRGLIPDDQRIIARLGELETART